MPELLIHHVARILDQLTKVSSPSRRDVKRCLALLRPYLLAAEASDEDIDRFVNAVHRALAEGEVMLRLNSAKAVRATVEAMLEQELGFAMAHAAQDWLRTAPAPREMETRKWCLKEFENHTRKTKRTPRHRRPENFDRRLPRDQTVSTFNPFTMRTALPAADEHPRELDREAVDRLLRQLGMGGRDFGPEPPAGGSPARV